MAIEPVTREERFLAAAGGQSVTTPEPITRKEQLLQGIIDAVKSGGATPDVIKNAVNNYLDANPVQPGATTEQAAQIEQNKTDIADLRAEIEDKQPKGDYVKTVNGNKPDATGNVVVDTGGNGSGQNATNADVSSIKTVLGNLMTIIKAQVEDDAGTPQGYNMDVSGLVAQNDALISALGNSGDTDGDDTERTLTSISATYSGGSVTAGTAVSALTGVVVTAHYSDGTSEAVTGYTLSGTISEGSNTITVSYGGKTTTFTVTGTAESGGGAVTNTIFPLADGTSSDGAVVVENNHVTISTTNRTINLTDVSEDTNIDTDNAYQMYAGKSYTLAISNYTNEGANYYKTLAIRGNDGTDIYKNDKVTGDGTHAITPEADCTATCIYFIMNQGSKVEFDVSFAEVTA